MTMIRNSMELHEGLWQVLFTKLQLRTLYRLLFLSHQLNGYINKNLFWRELIVRDLGLVPLYTTNYKLYYLKQMKFGVPLTMYRAPINKINSKFALTREQIVGELVPIMDKVVMANNQFIVHENYISARSDGRTTIDDLVGVSARKMFHITFPDDIVIYVLFTGGFICAADDCENILSELVPADEVITDITTIEQYKYVVVVTKSGKVFLNGQLQLSPEPMLSIVNNRLLSVTGNYHRWRIIDHDKEPSELHQRCSLQFDDPRPITGAGRARSSGANSRGAGVITEDEQSFFVDRNNPLPIFIDSSGIVTEKQHSESSQFNQEEFDRYLMVDFNWEYEFRGFEYHEDE